ncbi:MAG: cation diffusion facilitator family transporter, partial [Chitinophagaceae bacterium]|nr:cation diffusion facilitator family transporter [Chitinophagaceae bacterium]
MPETKQHALRIQQALVTVTVVLFIIKIIAWRLTGSVAILTDALESTVNVVAGFVGLYSISLSAKPRDREHPYGHGKVEFISSAIEGILISVAGIIIVYEAIDNFYHPHALRQLDYGLLLVFATAAINFGVGVYCVQKGKSMQSPVLQASGAHLKSDAYSSFGLMLGVLLILLTQLAWIDSVAALIFAIIIIVT